MKILLLFISVLTVYSTDKHFSKRNSLIKKQEILVSSKPAEVEVKGFVEGGEFHNTFGSTEENVLLWNDIHGDIEKCTEFTEIDLADNIGGTANFYISTPNYNAFKGIDLVPESKEQYRNADNNGAFFYDNFNFEDARYYNERVKLRTCTIPATVTDGSEEGFTWTVQRLGPFESQGNYDWWQFGWSDLGNFKEVLDKHPGGIYVDLQNIGPIKDGTWERLEYPPIHIHHVHAIPDPNFDLVRQRTTFAKYNISLFVEQHGDYQCLEKDGGVGCLMQTSGKGRGKWFNTPLSVDGEMNDVRPPRSEKLKYWVEFALRWTTDASKIKEQISFVGFSQPGKFDIAQQQTYVLTYPAPTAYPSLLWYTGKMPTSGKMVVNRIHSHAAIFHSSYFINATPKELGLDDPKFMSSKGAYAPLDIKGDLGFESIEESAKWFLKHIESHPEKVICRALMSGVVIDGFIYDRRPPTQCRPWTFKEGEDITVITFNKHEGYPAGAHMPDVIPEVIPNHAVWGMYYIDHKLPYSTFSLDVYSQTGFFFGTKKPPSIITVLFMALVYGGTFQASTRDFIHIMVIPVLLIVISFIIAMIWKCKSIGLCSSPTSALKRLCCCGCIPENNDVLNSLLFNRYIELPQRDIEKDT